MQSSNQFEQEEMALLEKQASEALFHYVKSGQGKAARLSRAAGVPPYVISKIANGHMKVQPVAAMAIEIASGRKLQAAVLCPSHARLFEMFRSEEPLPEGTKIPM